jgi:hypothetical protein
MNVCEIFLMIPQLLSQSFQKLVVPQIFSLIIKVSIGTALEPVRTAYPQAATRNRSGGKVSPPAYIKCAAIGQLLPESKQDTRRDHKKTQILHYERNTID